MIIFLFLVHCASCSNFWIDYFQDLNEWSKNNDDSQPDELATNYPRSNLLVSKGDVLEVKISTLFSKKTNRNESYYSLPFCRPDNVVNNGAELENSTYVFRMLEPQVCNVVCRITLDHDTANKLTQKMNDNYHVNMILAGIPLVMQRSSDVYQLGYPIGENVFTGMYSEQLYFINNHLIFTVKYRKDPETNSMTIAEFLVQPKCIRHKYVGEWMNEKTRLTTCYSDANHKKVDQIVYMGQEIIFTYDVLFEEVVDPVGHHSSR